MLVVYFNGFGIEHCDWLMILPLLFMISTVYAFVEEKRRSQKRNRKVCLRLLSWFNFSLDSNVLIKAPSPTLPPSSAKTNLKMAPIEQDAIRNP